MAAALRRKKEPYEKQIERLEADNKRLQRENDRLKELMRFLPAESFLEEYGLLVEACYLLKRPDPTVKTWEVRKLGPKLPIKNFRAHGELRRVDKVLYRQSHYIAEWFDSQYDDPDQGG